MSDSDRNDDNIPGNRALRFIGSMLAPMKASAEEQKQLREVAECLMFAQTVKAAVPCQDLMVGASAIGVIAGLDQTVKHLGDRLIMVGATKPLGQFKTVKWINNIAQIGVFCWMFNKFLDSAEMATSARHYCRLLDTKARHLEDYKKSEPSSTWTVARPFSAVATQDMHKSAVNFKQVVAPECIDFMNNKIWTIPKYLGVRVVANRWIGDPQLSKVIDLALGGRMS